jgi:excisionase family DNA binding protein
MSERTALQSADVAATPLLYSPEEAAARLRISRTKMFDLIRRREVRSIKIDGLRRISETALRDYVVQLEEQEAAV